MQCAATCGNFWQSVQFTAMYCNSLQIYLGPGKLLSVGTSFGNTFAPAVLMDYIFCMADILVQAADPSYR